MNITDIKLYSFEEMIPYIKEHECNHLRIKRELDEISNIKHKGNGIGVINQKQKSKPEPNSAINININQNKSIPRESFFIHPRETTDRLFWYAFIMIYGYEKYEYHKHKKDVEFETKYKFIERIRDIGKQEPYKSLFRKHKLKGSDIMNDIASNASITISSFIGICLIHDVALVLMTKTYYVYYGRNEEEDEDKDGNEVKGGPGLGDMNGGLGLGAYIISFESTNPKYPIKLNANDEQETKYKQPFSSMYYEKKSVDWVAKTRVEGKHIYKPLAGMSAYKMGELLDMGDVLGIDTEKNMNTGKKWKKSDIYEVISGII